MRAHAHAHLWFGSTAEKMQSTDSHSVEEVGEVESNPVSKAIARHLGIDISAEGRLAKNRKGIAIIVHGTPMSGMRQSRGETVIRDATAPPYRTMATSAVIRADHKRNSITITRPTGIYSEGPSPKNTHQKRDLKFCVYFTTIRKDSIIQVYYSEDKDGVWEMIR